MGQINLFTFKPDYTKLYTTYDGTRCALCYNWVIVERKTERKELQLLKYIHRFDVAKMFGLIKNDNSPQGFSIRWKRMYEQLSWINAVFMNRFGRQIGFRTPDNRPSSSNGIKNELLIPEYIEIDAVMLFGMVLNNFKADCFKHDLISIGIPIIMRYATQNQLQAMPMLHTISQISEELDGANANLLTVAGGEFPKIKKSNNSYFSNRKNRR